MLTKIEKKNIELNHIILNRKSVQNKFTLPRLTRVGESKIEKNIINSLA